MVRLTDTNSQRYSSIVDGIKEEEEEEEEEEETQKLYFDRKLSK